MAFATVGYLALLLTVLATALHSSLQHEVLHGHPTRSPLLNELLASPGLGLWFPYRRYRTLHLLHHTDPQLTDPLEDPESWYVTPQSWQAMPWPQQRILRANATLLGRLILGPVISWLGFWRSDFTAILRGHRQITADWVLHGVGLIPVILVLQATTLPLWQYALFVAYPATSIVLLRSFIEHRADEDFRCRTAVVEAGWFMRLMFLNNNLHAVHHRYPALPWFALPTLWQDRREQVLAENGGYLIAGGYREVAQRWFLRRREPTVHPFPPASDSSSHLKQ